jgi:Fic family protein
MKRGIDFISDTANHIAEDNIYRLYMMTIGDFLGQDNALLSGNFYRHGAVYVVGNGAKHEGLPHSKLAEYMKSFVKFAQSSDMDDLKQAAAMHFFIAYLHPYFDGNGRMARLIHLWHLIRRGYPSTLFVPFSKHIEGSKKKYYDAFTIIEENETISGILDITPFLVYFAHNVYDKLEPPSPDTPAQERYRAAYSEGNITEKERDLWNFILSEYGRGEFSTKTLEYDFHNAAYATIRSFVIKFERFDLLAGQRYGNRVKYRIKDG